MSTRQKRGKRVKPNNWNHFHGFEEIKTELSAFLSQEAVRLQLRRLAVGTEMYAPEGSGVFFTLLLSRNIPALLHICNIRLRLPLVDAVQNGCKEVTMRSVDTGVAVLIVPSLSHTGRSALDCLCVVSKSQYIAVQCSCNDCYC